MEGNQEESIWQRVTAPPNLGSSREQLRNLLQSASERATLFQNLAGQSSKSWAQVRVLRELEQANVACLKGMMAFGGRETPLPNRLLSPAPLRQTLIRGYYLAKKAAAEYTARSVESEFGVVFQEMASRENRICALVTQLLGEVT